MRRGQMNVSLEAEPRQIATLRARSRRSICVPTALAACVHLPSRRARSIFFTRDSAVTSQDGRRQGSLGEPYTSPPGGPRCVSNTCSGVPAPAGYSRYQAGIE
ncbi:unnamed protein product [Arctogadus glacialis]